MNYRVQDELPSGRSIRPEPINWQAHKDKMIEENGRWVLIEPNVSTSTPHQIRRGNVRLFRGEEIERFEFATRKPEDPEVSATYKPNFTDLWGRYTGGAIQPTEKPKRSRRARS